MTSVYRIDKRQEQHEESLDASEEDHTKCDFIFCAPDCCQKFRRRKVMLFWLGMSAFTQSLFFTGFFKSSITMLEKRFNMSSKEAGAAVSFYSVGNLMALLPVSYFGGTIRRLRCVSGGMFLIGLGSFLCALPQATAGLYKYKTSIEPICYRNGNDSFANICDNKRTGGLNAYKYLFWIALTVVGWGVAPLYTAGTSYIDDNCDKKIAHFYIATFYGCSILGPATGFVLSSIFLQMYVDIGHPHPNLNIEDNTSWVGAWWIGFLISGTLAMLTVVPLYGFPIELPGTKTIREEKESEAFGSTEEISRHLTFKTEDMLKNFMVIVRNPTFISVCLSAAAEDMLITGLSTFAPKYLETVFGISSQMAVLAFGSIMVPFGTLGIGFGGLVMNRFRMTLPAILRFQTLVAALILPLMMIFFVPCGLVGDDVRWAGITVPYNNHSTEISLDHSCNVDCHCLTNRILYSPMCGSNFLTYYSPCYAGCSAIDNSSKLTCSCINDNSNGTYVRRNGPCSRDCRNVPIFLALLSLIIFATFTLAAPTITSTMRCLPEKQKTFGLGVQWIIVRSMGSIPGALVVGAIFDSTCTLWSKTCDEDVKCTVYDPDRLRDRIVIMGFMTKLPVTFFLAVAWWLYKPNVIYEEGGVMSTDSTRALNPFVNLDESDKTNKKLRLDNSQQGEKVKDVTPDLITENEITASFAAILGAMPVLRRK